MGSSKLKQEKRKKKKGEELEEIAAQRMMMETRLTYLWIQDLEKEEKVRKKALQLARKRKIGYIL